MIAQNWRRPPCHVAATWQMIGAYEDVLARVIADGTDDLVTPSR